VVHSYVRGTYTQYVNSKQETLYLRKEQEQPNQTSCVEWYIISTLPS